MNERRDPDRLIEHFLSEGREQLHDQVYDAVRASIEQQRQRVVIGPWRMPDMSKFVPAALGVAGVILVAVMGAQLLRSPAPDGVGGAPSPTPTTQPTGDATPKPTLWTGIAAGPFLVASDAVQVTVDIASPGWTGLPDFDAVTKADDGLDPPETVGAALLAWAWPAGTGFYVYGDPCRWSTTVPETASMTAAEIAEGLAAQASREASPPEDVTVGGYTGKTVTLRVPMSFEVPGASREEEFAACDGSIFGSYAAEGETEPSRNHQGPGQIDEFWILDVNGSIVILDAMYGPAAPADLVDELRELAESATFD